ncbi:50S ribosomal protein L19 [Patescibacteria group bacterium]|nr:50S ribosomal protein L19 [Patescibacteria group bacterium]
MTEKTQTTTEDITHHEDSTQSVPSWPDFRPGDIVRVLYKIIEGKKVRTQPYEGIVIAKKGSGVSKTFTVRRIGVHGIGVERIFPFYSPNIEKLEVVKRGKVRRAKLYYLREKKGKEAMRVRERKTVKKVKNK